MANFYAWIAYPFGLVLSLFYNLSGNYVFSIFALMLVVKLLVLPSSISQQKGQAKQARLQPKIRKIQERYAGDQQKINRATQELYQKEGFSAMRGGCAPMAVQMIVMLGLFQVNYHPLSMVLRLPKALISEFTAAVTPLLSGSMAKNASYRAELYALQHFSEIKSGISGLTPEISDKISSFISRYNFLGLDLAVTPNFKNFDKYWAIPVITGLIALGTALYSFIRQKKLTPGNQASNMSMGCMMFMTPAMQIYFSFLFPTAVGIYIIFSSIISFVQMVVLNHTHSPEKVLARLMIEESIERRSKEENIKKIAEIKKSGNI